MDRSVAMQVAAFEVVSCAGLPTLCVHPHMVSSLIAWNELGIQTLAVRFVSPGP